MVGDFYGTGIEIWAGFGLDLGWLALLEKRVWADYEQFLRVVFSCYSGKKELIFFENIVKSALKSCIK